MTELTFLGELSLLVGVDGREVVQEPYQKRLALEQRFHFVFRQ